MLALAKKPFTTGTLRTKRGSGTTCHRYFWKKAEIRLVLTIDHKKEALGRAYLRAVAAIAGANVTIPEHDYGIDATFTEVHQRTENGTFRYVDFNDFKVQLKCTTTLTDAGDDFLYDLEAKTYNDLVLTPNTPRILVVLRLPDDEGGWMSLTAEQLVIQHCAYWISFRGQPATTNTATIRVRIPKIKMFSPDGVRGIFQRIREGGLP